MTDWLMDWQMDLLTDWTADCLINWLRDWLMDWQIDLLTDWPTDSDKVTARLTNGLTDQQTDLRTDWLRGKKNILPSLTFCLGYRMIWISFIPQPMLLWILFYLAKTLNSSSQSIFNYRQDHILLSINNSFHWGKSTRSINSF